MSAPVTAWLVLAVVAALVEISLPSFGFLFVSAGALVAALGALAGLGIAAQVFVFVVALTASLLLLRPRLVAKLGARGVPSRTEALIGQRAHVTEDINATLGTGRITVAGQDWAARSRDVIPAGADVHIDGADGIVLEVSLPTERPH